MSGHSKPYLCNWCGLPGHRESACHVKAEGRREPDEADRVACAALLGLTKVSDVRAATVRLVRRLLAGGEDADRADDRGPESREDPER